MQSLLSALKKFSNLTSPSIRPQKRSQLPNSTLQEPINVNPLKSQKLQTDQYQQRYHDDYRNKKIGFIGVGTISKAMIQGLCNPQLKEKKANSILISPRSIKNSEELAREFSQVVVAQNNQEVVDNSEWIVIGVLTTQVKEVLKDLNFRDNQTIINLAAMPNEEFSNCINSNSNIVRACPLPPIALNVGATILSPPNQEVEKMFNVLGKSVPVNTPHEIYSLQGLACLQGMQFAIYKSVYDWMVEKQNIESNVAKDYILNTFYSISLDALSKVDQKGKEFDDLIKEQTPGGLNEQNLKYLEEKQVFNHIQDALEITYTKMIKKK